MNTSTYKYNTWLYYLILVLLVPALLINLGIVTLIDDEALRALVGLEMKYSGNFIAPTVNGEFYYKKPPLYNWILLSFFELTGTVNEWTVRLPTVFFLIAYASTIFYYLRKHFSFHLSFLGALMMITCGRMLFYDSMLGLIDTCYSWTVFVSFMVVYHSFEKEEWLKLFVLSYLLAAVGFLMKGLPSVVFQGATLLVYFAYRRRFWKLFSWQHLVGGLSFIIIVGGYYLLYHQYNSLENVFTTLFTETTKRTVANHSIWRTISHFITFPLEMIYHFLPWTLLVIYFIRKDILQLLQKHPFVVFSLICFLANILVYWTAPKVHPRYVFMLVPLFFTAYLYLHQLHEKENTWAYRTLYYLFGSLITLTSIVTIALPFIDRLQNAPYLYIKTLFLFSLIASLCFFYWKKKAEPLLVLIAVLLVVRIGFNWFVIPDRLVNDYGTDCRTTSIAAAQATLNEPIAVYKDSEMQYTNGFYFTITRKAIVPIHFDNFAPETIYIIEPEQYPDLECTEITTFKVRHGKEIYPMGYLPEKELNKR
ncbi:MAG: glycosyltransferase family 39 protein [Chitinophagales bacterium]|nr:glycosyltransferase family 39 protein [Chitinophagales bacterium]